MNRRQHPYCYDGTDVLKNKEVLRDPLALERLERTFSALRALTLKPQPVSVNGYKAIHRHLLQDVYNWAGLYRTMDTGRGPAPFCLARFIERNMQDRFAAILGQKKLKG